MVGSGVGALLRFMAAGGVYHRSLHCCLSSVPLIPLPVPFVVRDNDFCDVLLGEWDIPSAADFANPAFKDHCLLKPSSIVQYDCRDVAAYALFGAMLVWGLRMVPPKQTTQL